VLILVSPPEVALLLSLDNFRLFRRTSRELTKERDLQLVSVDLESRRACSVYVYGFDPLEDPHGVLLSHT
jgi:hypothetical protein